MPNVTNPMCATDEYAISFFISSCIRAINDVKIIYDINYNPSSSTILDQAKNKKLKTQNGLRMLVEQAVASFKIWHGFSPTVDEKLLEKLGA